MLLEFVIIQSAVFVVVIFVLRRLMVKNTMSAVNRLKVVDEENARRLEEMKRKIEEAEAAYRQKSADLARALAQQEEEAKKQVDEERSRLLARSREEGDRIVSSARNRSEKIDEEIGKELEKRAATLSRRIVREVLDGTIGASVNERLVDQLLEEFAAMDIGHVPQQTSEAEIVLPHPFSPDRKKRVREILEKKIGRKIEIRETVKKEMLGGMILRLGSLVMDGSLENKVDGIALQLNKQK